MIRDDLARLIKAGYNALGELEFTESSHGYLLYHWADRNSLPEAEVYHSTDDARQIAKFDSSGAYRPLKGAPNLPRGWLIELTSIDALQRALDYFYPGAIGSWLAYQRWDGSSRLLKKNAESAIRNVSSDTPTHRRSGARSCERSLSFR